MKIEVHRARLPDFPWIRRLAVRSAIYGIPHGRDIKNSQVQAVAQEHLKDLELTAGTGRNFLVLLALDSDTDERLGYIMLDFDHVESSTGERQSLIYDLAVEPRHWGKQVVHRLVEAAARETAGRGLKYMVGEVTAGNRRTLVQALRLGFQVERYQIVMCCSPEGPVSMPGRTEEEKAHDVSRDRRRAARLRQLRRIRRKQELKAIAERDPPEK
ncbi:MAG: GNAT family N-acetyltransferase [Armatimonadetes bacterium]|nr:GNAT family N-acetyltransferase [Armatimonadota bacterium]